MGLKNIGIARKSEVFKAWLNIFILLFQRRRNFGSHGFLRLLTREIALREYSLTESEKAENFIENHLDFFNPKNKFKLSYAGPPNDSGYFFANLFAKPLIISGGAGKNVDFEMSFRDRGSQVYLFDGSMRSEFEMLSGIQTYKHNLGRTNTKTTISLNNFLEKNAILNSSKDMGIYLKLDIEGSEIEVLEDLLSVIDRFDQLILEVHDLYKLGEPQFRNRVENLLRHLEKHFFSVFLKSNNWENFVQFGKSFAPNVFEITLVNSRNRQCVEIESVNVEKIIHLNNPRRLAMPGIFFKHSE